MTEVEWFEKTIKVYIDSILNNDRLSSGNFELSPSLGWTARNTMQALKGNGYKQVGFHDIDEDTIEVRFQKDGNEIRLIWGVYDFDLYCSVLKG